MAYILDQEEEQQGSPQSSATPLVGGGSAQVGGTTAPTGSGPAGQGGWTNIQSYLDANKTNPGSANTLSKTVGDQFSKEETDMQSKAQGFLGDAKNQVEKSSITTDQADKYINDASVAYSYGPTQADDYQGYVSKVQGALNNQYSGPKEYTYALGADTQNYGSQLKDDSSFDGLMTNMYSKNAGAPLSYGQSQLQKQLDVNNTYLTEARNKLLGQYSGLENKRDQVVKDTTGQLSGLEQQYRTNQNALKDYLYNKSSALDTAVAQQEADARAAYGQSFRGDKTGQGGALRNSGLLVPTRDEVSRYVDRGIWGQNLTAEQLQREQDMVKNNEFNLLRPVSLPGMPDVGRKFTDLRKKQYNQNVSANNDFLSGWYRDQDIKYQDTADADERRFNAVQDFLGLTTPKKQQGFKVRE